MLIVCRKTVIKLPAGKERERRNIIHLISIAILILLCFKLLMLFSFSSTGLPVCIQLDFCGRRNLCLPRTCKRVHLPFSRFLGKVSVDGVICQYGCWILAMLSE